MDHSHIVLVSHVGILLALLLRESKDKVPHNPHNVLSSKLGITKKSPTFDRKFKVPTTHQFPTIPAKQRHLHWITTWLHRRGSCSHPLQKENT